jgi:thioredoxin 1
MPRIIFFLSILFIVTSGKAQQRLSPKQFRQKLAATPEALLLDIRTPQEINKGYLEGAVFMDFYDSTFKQQLTNLDKEKPVFVYCAIGGRSWDAAKMMGEMGFKQVYDLKGGIIVWKIKNYDFVKLKNDVARQGITKTEFENQLANKGLSLVDFYAPWCAPCKIMVPALERMEKEMKDTVNIVKINADENLQLMKDYGVKALPYILIMRGKKIIFRHEGFMSEDDMRALVRKYYLL